jgi:hypothetical protein
VSARFFIVPQDVRHGAWSICADTPVAIASLLLWGRLRFGDDLV